MKLGTLVKPMKPISAGHRFSTSARSRGSMMLSRNRFSGHTAVSGVLKGKGKQKIGSYSGSLRRGLVKHSIKI